MSTPSQPKAQPTHVCSETVSDRTGFHWWPCKRPAKFLVTYDDGRAPKYRCGIHAKRLPPFATRTPVAALTRGAT